MPTPMKAFLIFVALLLIFFICLLRNDMPLKTAPRKGGNPGLGRLNAVKIDSGCISTRPRWGFFTKELDGPSGLRFYGRKSWAGHRMRGTSLLHITQTSGYLDGTCA